MLINISLLLAFLGSNVCFGGFTGKIVGGNDADIRNWPFIAYIRFQSGNVRTTCGGSLISSQTILTAAHCFDGTPANFMDKDNITVFMGAQDHRRAPVSRNVIDFIVFSGYNSVETYGDVAIAFLNSPVKFSDTVKKVLLQMQPLDTLAETTPLLIAGWGSMGDTPEATSAKKLQYLRQKMLPIKECRDLVTDLDVGSFCAGKPNVESYVYSGDSGGPLVTEAHVQIGIVSYKLVGTNGVTVYTDVSYYIEWIKQNQMKLFTRNCLDKKPKNQGNDIIPSAANMDNHNTIQTQSHNQINIENSKKTAFEFETQNAAQLPYINSSELFVDLTRRISKLSQKLALLSKHTRIYFQKLFHKKVEDSVIKMKSLNKKKVSS